MEALPCEAPCRQRLTVNINFDLGNLAPLLLPLYQDTEDKGQVMVHMLE